MERLKGSALLEKIRELKNTEHREIARICGYVSDSGRILMQSFYNAMMEANGAPSGGRRATGQVAVHKTGMVIVGSSWTSQLGLKTGDNVNISVSRGRIVITTDKSTEGETDSESIETDAITGATADTITDGITDGDTTTTTWIDPTSSHSQATTPSFSVNATTVTTAA